MWQGIIWDLDGTIADSEELHFLSWQDVMRGQGVDYTHEWFLQGFGRSNPAVLRSVLGEDLSDQEAHRLGEAKEIAFRAMLADQLQLLPGVTEWLERFRAQGLKQAVASSAPTANIAAMLTELAIGDYFAVIVSGAHLAQGKPHPTIFINAAAGLALSPGNCLVMEDSGHGIEAARRAGMATVAVGPRAAQAAQAGAGLPAAPVCLVAPNLAHLSWDALHA